MIIDGFVIAKINLLEVNRLGLLLIEERVFEYFETDVLQYGSLGCLLVVATTSRRQAHAKMLLDEVNKGLWIIIDILIGLIKDDQFSFFHSEDYVIMVSNLFLEA